MSNGQAARRGAAAAGVASSVPSFSAQAMPRSAFPHDHAALRGSHGDGWIRLCHDSACPDGEWSGPMLHVGVLALGVADVQRAARFWCAALDYEVRTDGFGGWATVLVLRSGSGLKIALQRSETALQDHPRLHLDLHAVDAAERATEVDRLVSLGARRIDWDSYPDDPDFVVLADPEGNIFCIVDLSHNRR